MNAVVVGVVVVAALDAVVVTRLVLLALRSRETPSGLGLVGGRLRPCPASPNCVSSEGADEKHRVQPLPARETFEATRQALRAAIEAAARGEGSTVVMAVDEPTYLRAVFRTRVLGYHDDLELRLDVDEKLVHVRSASRVGFSDFGTNRRRVDLLRSAYLA